MVAGISLILLHREASRLLCRSNCYPALRLVSGSHPGFPRAVRWLEKLERKMDWLHFRGLFKCIAFLSVVAWICKLANPQIVLKLVFDKEAILEGEVWRVFTFLFAPTAVRGFSWLEPIWVMFAMMLSFMISDALEQAWGSTRTTLYILTGWLGMVAVQFLLDFPFFLSPMTPGLMLYVSVFLAFATLFPKAELSLMMLIPIEVRFLGAITAILMVVNIFSFPPMAWIAIPAMLPYLLWVLPGVFQSRKTLVQAASRRRKFTVAKGSAAEPFHVCEVCRRTEHDPADLEFFVMPDGKEYCSEHLPKS
jgi:hypothetical protein